MGWRHHGQGFLGRLVNHRVRPAVSSKKKSYTQREEREREREEVYAEAKCMDTENLRLTF